MYLDLEIPLKNLGIQVLQTLDPPVPWTLPFFIENDWLAKVSFGVSDYCQWGHWCFFGEVVVKFMFVAQVNIFTNNILLQKCDF